MKKKLKVGQAGLLLLVVIGVVVGLILSIASRSISDSAMSRKGKENNETFSVAESGIEKALQILANGGTPPIGPQPISNLAGNIGGSYNVTETSSFELYVKEGESAQINLTGVQGDVLVNWVLPNEDPGSCSEGSGLAPASIEISLFTTTNLVTRSYFNSFGCESLAGNGFGNSFEGLEQYKSGMVVSVTNGDALRIKPIYNGTTVRVTTNDAVFNSTLFLIQSSVAGGDAQKEIEVKRSLDTAGSVFDYAIFSGGIITKP